MRLIDADKLYKALAKPSDLPGDTIDVMVVRLAILAAPEVKAISVRWIDSYITDCKIDLVDNDADNIKKMVEDWEKENGK